MPKIISAETETTVRTLSKENFSKISIKNKLKEDDVDISISSISRILKNVGLKRQAILQGKPVPKYRRPPLKRTPGMVKKIKVLANRENPASYRAMKNKSGLSLGSIHKVIHQDLGLQTRKKSKVHRLLPRHKKNRKTNCRKLYEQHLAGDRSEFAVTLDEALVYMNNVNGTRRICYVKKGEDVPDDWMFEKNESFSTKFMVIGVITGRGTVPLFRVPPKVKINAEYYVEYVLKPLFRDHLPRLYPNDMHNVFFHHDKASSHTADLTTAYLEKMKTELGISYLEKQDIPVKCPDGSPLDFFGFGYLKQKLFPRKARTMEGVWKIAQEVWSQLDLPLIKSVFNSWKIRLRLITARDGQQIEHTKAIHSKQLNRKNN